MMMESFAFASHKRFSRVSASSLMASTETESVRVRYPKRPLSDFFYSLDSLEQE